jgi:hypothetical protein
MRKETFLLTLFILTSAGLCCATVVKPQKRVQAALNGIIEAATAKITTESVTSAAKSATSTLARFYLARGEAGLTITIVNNMTTERDLVSPKLYLNQGYSINQPPLRIRDRTKPNDGKTHAIFMEGNPAGVLCYECPRAGQTSQSDGDPEHICLHFNWKDKGYNVAFDPPNGAVDEASLKQHFGSLPFITTRETGRYFGFKDDKKPLNVWVIAMMTSGKNPRLYFEIQDRTSTSTHAWKREFFTLATVATIATAALPAVGMKAYAYYKAERGTVLTLENLSNQLDPFVLIDPIWYQNGIEVQDFIPYTIVPGQVSDVTLLAPSGKGAMTNPSVFLLSYLVKGYHDRIVLAIWWPLKLMPGKKNRYSLTLLRDYQTAVGHKPQSVEVELKEIADCIQKYPKDQLKANEATKTRTSHIISNINNLQVNHN